MNEYYNASKTSEVILDTVNFCIKFIFNLENQTLSFIFV